MILENLISAFLLVTTNSIHIRELLTRDDNVDSEVNVQYFLGPAPFLELL